MQNPAPTCENPVGKWTNQLGSTLDIKKFDTTTGQISGEYFSPSGTQGDGYPLVGWINDGDGSGQNSARVISWSVRWGAYGSIASWTGTCQTIDGVGQIDGMWHLARPETDYDWDHILAGKDVFHPAK